MQRIVTIEQIRNHFFEVAHWVDPERTCDVIYFGDPRRQINRIGTGWSCCSQNLEAAASDGCELYISHEALFHGEYWAPATDSKDTPWGRRRLAALKSSGMACMRHHDTWDNFPEYGIRDSWRHFLDLTDLVAECAYYDARKNRYAAGNSLALCRIEAQSMRNFASHVADRCSAFPCFQGATLHGNPDAEVKLVATGVGCHIPSLEMLELGADVLIVTFDRALQGTIRIPFTEMNANVIAVEHGVAEMPGMQSMASYLEQTFPGISVTFYCREPFAEIITGKHQQPHATDTKNRAADTQS
jgi:putative NIF3 family GTP cyclohydrolase 1 type 2